MLKAVKTKTNLHKLEQMENHVSFQMIQMEMRIKKIMKLKKIQKQMKKISQQQKIQMLLQ